MLVSVTLMYPSTSMFSSLIIGDLVIIFIVKVVNLIFLKIIIVHENMDFHKAIWDHNTTTQHGTGHYYMRVKIGKKNSVGWFYVEPT